MNGLDWRDANTDPVLISIGVVFLICAVYALFLRRAIMLGFLSIIGVVVVGIIMLWPDQLTRVR